MAIAWKHAHATYLRSGLTKIEFYRKDLVEFSDDGRLPCVYTYYKRFQRLEQIIPNPPDGFDDPIPIRQIGGNVCAAGAVSSKEPQIGQVGQLAQDLSCMTSKGDRRLYAADGLKRDFRMKLPNGTEISFETKSPELLAMQMLVACGGAA